MTSRTTEYGYFSGKRVADLGDQIRSGRTSSVELTIACLDSISRLNPALNAFVHVDREAALARAKAADDEIARGIDRGALHGIPVGVKDNIDTLDMPTTYGTRFFATHRPKRDARCVENLRNAGAIIVGKTLTSEFAMGPTGEFSLQGGARNPHDLTRVCGGSSAGSGCAVGSGMVPLAVGTDTGGSIRIPASFCGVVGLKPTYNKVSLDGVFPVSHTLDHVGPIANNCEDASALLGILAGDRHAGRIESSLDTPRVAWLDSAELMDVDQDVLRAARSYVEHRFATSVSNAAVTPGLLTQAKFAVNAIFMAEALASHSDRVRDHSEMFCSPVLNRLQEGKNVAGWEYARALQIVHVLEDEIRSLFDRFDLIMLPTTSTAAPMAGQKQLMVNGNQYPINAAVNSLTGIWNLLGNPTVSLPAGMVDGLPVGVQAVARQDCDYWLLALLGSRSN